MRGGRRKWTEVMDGRGKTDTSDLSLKRNQYFICSVAAALLFAREREGVLIFSA